MHRDVMEKLAAERNPWWRDPSERPGSRFPVKRDLHAKLLEFLSEGSRRATLLLGPRQVGKTVLLQQIVDELLRRGLPPRSLVYFDFSDDRLPAGVSPRDLVDALPVAARDDPPRIFVLDEISRAAGWALWLKQAVDEGRSRYLATDSVASLLRGAQESGQGRWDTVSIEGLSLSEFLRFVGQSGESPEDVLNRAPNVLERYVAIGGFPEHAFSEDLATVRQRLRADIADRAILRDLSSRGLDVERVKGLFVYLVQASGAIFSAGNRASDLDADQRSINDWLRALIETHLVKRLEPHAKSAAVRLRGKPKIYVADHGLVSAFALGAAPHLEEATRGRAFEAVVYRHLRSLAISTGSELSYYRENDDLEADFVFEIGGEKTVLEVTSRSSPEGRRFDRVRRVGRELRTKRLVIVHGGAPLEGAHDVRLLPLSRFLLRPESALEERS